MKISSRREHLVALESIAMTDIVLNMFIFFFISFSLLYTFNPDRAQSIKVELPTAGDAVITQEAAPLIITVTREGLVYLGNKEMSDDDLKAEISRRCKEAQKPNIALRSDRQAQFKDVVRVLSIISGCRIGNLNIEVVKEETDRHK
ncbi:MAG: biopolymer transporter ExbD [bacterium]